MTINKIKSSSSETPRKKDYEPSEVYSTYDLGVSSALLCIGFGLLFVKKDNPKKALFIFKRKAGIEEVSNDYFADKLEVKARSFFDAIKALKNKLYSE
jgi:hypothetical protein